MKSPDVVNVWTRHGLPDTVMSVVVPPVAEMGVNDGMPPSSPAFLTPTYGIRVAWRTQPPHQRPQSRTT